MALGMELLFEHYKAVCRNSLDVMVLLLHNTLVNEGLRVVSVGNNKTSELLPVGWNVEDHDYTIEYCKDGAQYTLKVLQMSETALINLLLKGTERVASLSVKIDDIVTTDTSCFESAYKERSETLAQSLKAELRQVFLIGLSDESSSPQPIHVQSHQDARREQHSIPVGSQIPPGTLRRDPPDFPGPDPRFYGQDDLDPLGGTGRGGMIFDPLRHDPLRAPGRPRGPSIPNLPPGAVPPGARFDPYGPDLDIDGTGPQPFRPNPDADHMRMPRGPGFDGGGGFGGGGMFM